MTTQTKEHEESEETENCDEFCSAVQAINIKPEERRKFLQLMVKALPNPILNKIVILKNMQLENKRRAIIEGKIKPDEHKSNFKEVEPVDEKTEYDFCRGLKRFKGVLPDAKGIPFIWLPVFRNIIISDMIEEQDEQGLLIDASVRYFLGNNPQSKKGHAYI
ncbi:nucleosome assembly protein 1-like 1 [Drosophila gunungcola]|uniref:nucleosome assembly protein 1-like 1 n=1 Tax=Drosophila gunungcola TaxID=103775 RepID=UPI0022E85FAF|nr:nucleosome assembly protein 1-like 1 [Drosophila gunungcola]